MATPLQGAPAMFRRVFVLLFAFGIGEAAFAASFIVPPDRDFVRKAQAIVIASALASHTELVNDRIVTITTMSIEEVIKGDIAEQTIDIYEPGGRYENRATIIPGTPRFNDGERALLFLSRPGDHWMVVDLTLGKFHFDTDILGHDVVLRDLSDSRARDLDGKPHREQRRSAEGFLQFLRGLSSGGPAKSDYLIDAELLVSEATLRSGRIRALAFSANSYTSDCGGGTGCRWNSFPQNLFASSIGSIPADITAVQTAINSWDGAPNASINYVYGGTDGTHTQGLCGMPTDRS